MAGIDYGMGKTNIDHATGIRYGVISEHSLASWFYDAYEPQYGAPTCPSCGNEASEATAIDDDCEDFEVQGHCPEYGCTDCRMLFSSEYAWPDEPLGYMLDTDGYRAFDCLHSDVVIESSPFYTYAPFCSPCVPGACNLDSPLEPGLGQNNNRAYCFSHDWFEDGKAPYRVFRVSDNSEVFPTKE